MSSTFNLNKLNIIKRALQTVNIIERTADGVDDSLYEYTSDILNLMVKKWEAQGINLWKRRLGYLFPAYLTNQYSVGSAGDHSSLSYNYVTLTAATSAANTSLPVTSTTNMAVGDYIGIKLTDNTRFWSTVASITDAVTVVITDALSGDAASGASILTYTTKLTRPLKLLRGTIKNITTGSESMIKMIGYDEYLNLPVKTIQGRPNNIYYDKLLQGTTPYTGVLYMFPTPNNVDEILTFSFQESLADMINATDYPDFPQEWGYAIIFNLACEMCYHLGKYTELQAIQPKADMELQIVQRFDSDDSPLRFR